MQHLLSSKSVDHPPLKQKKKRKKKVLITIRSTRWCLGIVNAYAVLLLEALIYNQRPCATH